MIKENPFYGVICPILTPFTKDGAICEEVFAEMVNRLIHDGVHGILVGGSTGESVLLNNGERRRLAEIAVSVADKRTKIFIHSGCLSTKESIELTEHAQKIGADGASAITPFFFGYSEEELFNYYLAVTQAVPDFPFSLYVFPGNAKHFMSTALFVRILEKVPNILAIKLSHPDLIQFQEYIQNSPEAFSVMNGVDALMVASLSIGSSGQVSGNANVFPGLFVKTWDAYQNGRFEEAREGQIRINNLRKILHDRIPSFKAALKIMGVDLGDTRAPISSLTNHEKEILEKEITDFKY